MFKSNQYGKWPINTGIMLVRDRLICDHFNTRVATTSNMGIGEVLLLSLIVFYTDTIP